MLIFLNIAICILLLVIIVLYIKNKKLNSIIKRDTLRMKGDAVQVLKKKTLEFDNPNFAIATWTKEGGFIQANSRYLKLHSSIQFNTSTNVRDCYSNEISLQYLQCFKRTIQLEDSQYLREENGFIFYLKSKCYLVKMAYSQETELCSELQFEITSYTQFLQHYQNRIQQLEKGIIEYRNSTRLFQALVSKSSSTIVYLNSKFELLDYNIQFKELCTNIGIQNLKNSISILFKYSNSNTLYTAFQEALKTQLPVVVEGIQFDLPNLGEAQVKLQFIPYKNFVSIIADNVTKEHKQSLQLIEKDNIRDILLNKAHFQVAIIKPSGEFITTNALFRKRFIQKDSSNNLFNIIDHLPFSKEEIEQVQETSNVLIRKGKVLLKGRYLQFEYNIIPLPKSIGIILYEDNLQKVTMTRMRHFLTSSQTLIAYFNVEGVVQLFNDQFKKNIIKDGVSRHFSIQSILPNEFNLTPNNSNWHQVLQDNPDLHRFKYKENNQNYEFQLFFTPTEIGVFGTDINHFEAHKIELNEALRITQEALESRTLFLSKMNHELRTPLNSIIGIVDLFQTNNLDGNQKQLLEIIKSSSNQLYQVINSILDLAKFESGDVPIDLIPTDLNRIFHNTIIDLQNRAYEKGISVSIESEILPPVLTDGFRIKQILDNLVNNALKFTHKGEIKIVINTISHTDTAYRFKLSVIDTGIGIPEDKLETIFEPFTQAENSTARQFGGTGLGLTIVKELIEALNGKIQIYSVVNEGTTMEIEFEFKIITEEELTIYHQEDIDVTKIQFLNGYILVVEDQTSNQIYIQHMLDMWNIQYVIANNGYEAIEYSLQTPFDLILMDIHMPEMNGFSTANIIKSNFENINANTPMYALSADSLIQVKQLQSAGMVGHISKPLKPINLYLILKQYFQANEIPLQTIPIEESAGMTGRFFSNTVINDLDLFNTLLLDFIEQGPIDLLEIRSAVRHHNLELILKTAHRIKQSIYYLGNQLLSQEFEWIEKEAGEGNALFMDSKRLGKAIETFEQMILDAKKH